MGSSAAGTGESVRVIVRLRPEERSTCADGKDLAGSCILCVQDQKLTVVDPCRGRSGSGGGGGVAAGGKREQQQQQGQQAHDFSFDRVFGPEATQEEVFDTVKPLVHATVDGEKVVIRARGGGGRGQRWKRI